MVWGMPRHRPDVSQLIPGFADWWTDWQNELKSQMDFHSGMHRVKYEYEMACDSGKFLSGPSPTCTCTFRISTFKRM